MDNPNIITNCCFRCVREWLQPIREPLLSWVFKWWSFWATLCCSCSIYLRVCNGVLTNHFHWIIPYEWPIWGCVISATAYNADDSMFPLAFWVMSFENYEDWSWFLKNLKNIVGDKEVVIISDRHLAFLCSVLEGFGLENHTYCYCHLMKNSVVFLASIT